MADADKHLCGKAWQPDSGIGVTITLTELLNLSSNQLRKLQFWFLKSIVLLMVDGDNRLHFHTGPSAVESSVRVQQNHGQLWLKVAVGFHSSQFSKYHP